MGEESLISTGLTEQERIINIVLDGLGSSHSRRAYQRALRDFLYWHEHNGRPRSIKP